MTQLLFKDYRNGPDDTGGNYEPLDIIDTNLVTSVNSFIKEKFNMKPCYPNPARDHVTFSYKINSFTSVKLELTDLQGKVKKTIVDEIKKPGNYEVTISVNNLPAGQYVYKLDAGPIQASNKLTIIK